MLRVCNRCGAGNRVPARHLADVGRCGWCREALPPQHTPISLREISQLDGLIRALRVPLLLELSPTGKRERLTTLAARLAGRAVVARLSALAAHEVVARYALEPPPRFVVFRDGRLVRQPGELLEPSTMAQLPYIS